MPPGTIVYNAENGALVAEVLKHGERILLLRGGKGGLGNAHFKSSTNRAPRQFTYGTQGESGEFKLVLKTIADAGMVGFPNAGKSTLLNALVGEERAIVSDIHGTTRDVIEDTININGIVFRFIDTAGIRETNDTIEALGIERSFQALNKADIVLWVIDQTEIDKQIAALSDRVLPACNGKTLILVLNKADLATSAASAGVIGFPENTRIISLSAKWKEGIEKLRSMLVEAANLPDLSRNDIIVTNVRHFEALSRALDSIHRVQEGLNLELSGDFISQDLRECIFHLSDIVGEVTTHEVLGTIFSKFCVGK